MKFCDKKKGPALFDTLIISYLSRNKRAFNTLLKKKPAPKGRLFKQWYQVIYTESNTMLCDPVKNHDKDQEENRVLNHHKKVADRLLAAWPCCQFHLLNDTTNKFKH